MIRGMGVLAVALIAVSGVARAEAPRPIYAVVRIGSSLADEDRVGRKRVGLWCMTTAMLRWGDIATGGVMEQRETVQDALEDAGLAVTPLGSSETASGRPALRLRAMVRAAGFNLCARNYLFDANGFSGDAALEIEWRVEGADGTQATHVSKVARHVDPKQAMPIASLYRRLLGDAAGDAAHWLLTPTP